VNIFPTDGWLDVTGKNLVKNALSVPVGLLIRQMVSDIFAVYVQ